MDNILERLLALPAPKSEGRLKITRVGHPARVMSDDSVLDSTLDMKAGKSDEVGDTSFPNHDIRLTGIFTRRHLRKT